MKRFECFDSFRGLMCIGVILYHQGLERYTFHGFHFGVMGFFILSSFLLTYRLIKQYESTKCVQNIFKITINYTIMRIFRIYIPFVIYCAIDRYYFNCAIKDTFKMINWITLTYDSRASHLCKILFLHSINIIFLLAYLQIQYHSLVIIFVEFIFFD